MTVITRFAPSPTGFLHIGSARTALFNWLFARHHGGQFHLRIEDTDRKRSTQGAVDALIYGLKWLQIDWDGDIVYQFARAQRHAEVAHHMVSQGSAYYCYCSPAEVEAMREKARAEGKPPRYDGRCRDRAAHTIPTNVKPVVRLRTPQNGEQTVHDLVQGQITVSYGQLDDLILLRADGTPTYMLSVVVDDHDMNITHIIRGEDHMTNTFRQKVIYDAMGWSVPHFAHIPLIHGADGAKLSKRHGALGVDAYEAMGLLPEAVCNYLTRLGWSHGDDEIFSRLQATAWFNLDAIGRAPARFDMVKLTNLNGHYLRETDNSRLLASLSSLQQTSYDDEIANRLLKGLDGLKQRAKTLHELADNAAIYTQSRPLPMDDKALIILNDAAKEIIRKIIPILETSPLWEPTVIEQTLRQASEHHSIKLGHIAQPLRAALTGKGVSPGIFEVMDVLGQKESLARLRDVLC